MSTTRESSDGSAVSLVSKGSVAASFEPVEAEESPDSSPSCEDRTSAPTPAPVPAPPSPPPPFTSLYYPSVQQRVAREASITEPEPPPPFYPTSSLHPVPSASVPTVEQEIKAAIPGAPRGRSLSKAADDADPPPPYTDGSSPLDSFTYVMAAAGGPASIITQVEQTGPQQGNSLAGVIYIDLESR